jgi:hypothetical protein
MAQALTEAAETELVAIAHTEWRVETGGYVPSSKAQVTTTLSLASSRPPAR